MKKIVIEPHYLGSLEYYVVLSAFDEVCFEINDSFPKQTFRNRAYFLTSNKIQPLIIPLNFSNGDPTKDVKVDYSQKWIKDHWGAFYSGYGKAPFYEYFFETFKDIWDKKAEFLVDLNLAFFEICCKVLQIKPDISVTTEFQIDYSNDHRNLISPKKPFSDRKNYHPVPYSQLFGDTFVPNLSIVDLIMCEGPNAAQILSNSTLRN